MEPDCDYVLRMMLHSLPALRVDSDDASWRCGWAVSREIKTIAEPIPFLLLFAAIRWPSGRGISATNVHVSPNVVVDG
ncbi:hypothetical protein W97_08587 [Coniosporium apollinis CBS 100218]|uniref:Uncharacterized protein n=1 Tax=Coniosporium apollinis (strain CBS 100218) TaxID=1168221 RepID=R7Z578_CONA1|nr:uncharacterized protein W97_08587 [Coniosporium apollinis CBS 100218]EON69327.1 hypothetical protein W97_08587 [Coniosporium apollinis CBS 100218]